MGTLDFLKITQETEQEFSNIASKLFNEYALKNKGSIYRLTEVEFYWKSPTHNDKSTYERRYVNPQTGEWFFHYSGIDIALRNDDIKGFGGILIRSIKDINSGKQYKGPQVCAMKLFSEINAFSDDFYPRIIKHNFAAEKLAKTERIGLGKNAKESGFEKATYRFIIKIL